MTSHEAFDSLCYWGNVAIAGDSAENSSFLTGSSLKYLDSLHSSITSNGLSIERKKERNVLFNDALNTFYLRLYGVSIW